MTFGTPTSGRLGRGLVAPLTLSAALLIAAVFLGVVDLPAADILAVLAGRGSDDADLVIGTIRIPRILTGILAGAHFAVAGLLLQAITRNPLADPTILGISQGATLTVTIFLLFAVYGSGADAHTLHSLPLHWLPLVACAGGMLTGLLVYYLAMRNRLSVLRLTLSGIAIGATLHALAMGLIAGWGSSRFEIVMQWLSGSLYARSWEHVVFLLPFTFAAAVALPLLHRSIDMLRFEEDVARSFGLSYRLHFSLVLLTACGLAASAVGTVGPLIFVGLVVPHLAHFLAGRSFGMVMPLTVVLGASLVTGADLAGRLLGQAEEIPIGVITALTGAPVLLFLLRRRS
ncbi:FecCD family ABC transporter permease [Ensifer aridi]|uniref:FecCD family ABC transporter permease n=1 Tax=Ensifer aridi TaxID=1708715 RepID=UPI000A107ADB|nr:iron ABC transporter permease [Ensifer aridi]